MPVFRWSEFGVCSFYFEIVRCNYTGGVTVYFDTLFLIFTLTTLKSLPVYLRHKVV
jgi:hypothetical protein